MHELLSFLFVIFLGFMLIWMLSNCGRRTIVIRRIEPKEHWIVRLWKWNQARKAARQ